MTIREKVARAIGLYIFETTDEDRSLPVETFIAKHADRIAIRAISAAFQSAAEEGWHMRPDEATPTMLGAAAKTPVKAKGRGRSPLWIYLEEVNLNMQHFEKARRAMLAAAPEFEWEDK